MGKGAVRCQGGRCRVELPPGSTYDVERFRGKAALAAAVASGAERAAILEGALGSVRGLYLEGWVQEWVIDTRWAIEAEITDAALTLANTFAGMSDWRRAERWYREVVRRDDLREDAHRGVMRAQAAQGNRALALRWYQGLERLLDRELCARPDPRTVALWQAISRDGFDLARGAGQQNRGGS
jgi:DNA-binding SARP family transcriptional activator